MKNSKRRIFALILSGVIAVSLAACQPSSNQPETMGSTAGEGKVFSRPTEISIARSSRRSAGPSMKSWPVLKYIQEATGATLKITAITPGDMGTKPPLMMATPDLLPDLIHTCDKAQVNDYALSGRIPAIPTISTRRRISRNSGTRFPKRSANEFFARAHRGRSARCTPRRPRDGTESVNNMRSWLYGRDIFERTQPAGSHDDLTSCMK